MSIPDYSALRAAVENEESILGLIGEAMCHPDYDALRAAVENEESILGLLNGAVQNRGTQSEEENRGWVTINGRHVLLRDKGAAGGGGFAETGLTTAGGSSTIKATREQRKEFEKVLIGVSTPNGIVITGVSSHAANRMIERNISADIIKKALSEAKITYPGNKENTYCVQNNSFRIVYSDKGNLISAIDLKFGGAK